MTSSKLRHREKLDRFNNEFTPAELAELIEQGTHKEFYFAIRPLLDNGHDPVRYVREPFYCEHANYYTARSGARRLIVAFCGYGSRIGVETSFFLQMMRDDLYDVLLLADPDNASFDRGIPGLSSSFYGTIERVRSFIAERDFDEIITFGASMGGYPALRAGILLRADRAISVGGRFPWHIRRLITREMEIRAFDPLCACYQGCPTKITAVVAANVKPDMANLETMLRNFPDSKVVLIDTRMHNVSAYFYRLGLLKLFYASLFEYGEQPVRDVELLSMLSAIARPANSLMDQRNEQVEKLKSDLRVQKDRAAKARKKLKAVYASTSWRLTEPFRALSRILRGGLSPRE